MRERKINLQPKLLRDFLVYLTTIRGKSMRTRKEYEYDLKLFFRFVLSMEQGKDIEEITSIKEVTIDLLKELTLEDLYLFMEYCEQVRGNGVASRARKVATLKSFFNYLRDKRRLLEENPAAQLETPKQVRRAPIYMTLPETKQFIAGAKNPRDFCIVTFFLNLGLRVTELCNLNESSIQQGYITIIGKGNKERIIYLNDACKEALAQYNEHKHSYRGTGETPLFISQKGTRLTRQHISRIIKEVNTASGFNKKGVTPHKLRHTSATLLYQAGADIRSLQQILGHESVATTQIYTHIEDEQLQQVLKNNPLND